MAAATKTSGRKWSEEEVEKLLNLWAEETIQISIDNAKTPKEKTAVYQTLKVQLEQQGVQCELKAILSKIRKLRQKYKEEKNKAKKSGRSRGRKWKFFHKMDSIMGHRANISPPLVLDSSADQNEESVMSESEDEKVSNDGVIDNERHVDEMEGESTPPPKEQGVSTCEHVKPKPPCEKPKSRSLPKKTKLEKSLEVLCDKMVSSSASEMDRFFRMEEERHKREMALQLEQAKIEAERRRQEREHELAVLQLLTRNAYMPTTSMQSSAGPGGYCPSGYEDGSHSSRSFAWSHGIMGGITGVVDQSAPSYSSSESSFTTL
ncbi:unnamed protein product [Porites lobata]|uniref:Myb/SANT-like DNA-binding domain-containing protein n=1 Tax=Porites lobata TaxID=104759 RepID=A0ABN8QWU9_9CNID|nr:unnamed protein product [Porites lobata]